MLLTRFIHNINDYIVNIVCIWKEYIILYCVKKQRNESRFMFEFLHNTSMYSIDLNLLGKEREKNTNEKENN